MILRAQPGQPDVLEIDMLGHELPRLRPQLEFEAMNIAVEAAHRRGARLFQADYVPTAKNAGGQRALCGLGLPSVEDAAMTAEGWRRGWQLPLAEYVAGSQRIFARKA